MSVHGFMGGDITIDPSGVSGCVDIGGIRVCGDFPFPGGGGNGPSPIDPIGTPPFTPFAPQPPFPELPQFPGGNGNGQMPVFTGGTTACGNKAMQPTRAQNGQLCCPTGWHLSTRKDPCTKVTTTCCVRNRRMNVLNPRALSKAQRRLVGWSKMKARTEKAMRGLCPPTRRRPNKPCK